MPLIVLGRRAYIDVRMAPVGLQAVGVLDADVFHAHDPGMVQPVPTCGRPESTGLAYFRMDRRLAGRYGRDRTAFSRLGAPPGRGHHRPRRPAVRVGPGLDSGRRARHRPVARRSAGARHRTDQRPAGGRRRARPDPTAGQPAGGRCRRGRPGTAGRAPARLGGRGHRPQRALLRRAAGRRLPLRRPSPALPQRHADPRIRRTTRFMPGTSPPPSAPPNAAAPSSRSPTGTRTRRATWRSRRCWRGSGSARSG